MGNSDKSRMLLLFGHEPQTYKGRRAKEPNRNCARYAFRFSSSAATVPSTISSESRFLSPAEPTGLTVQLTLHLTGSLSRWIPSGRERCYTSSGYFRARDPQTRCIIKGQSGPVGGQYAAATFCDPCFVRARHQPLRSPRE